MPTHTETERKKRRKEVKLASTGGKGTLLSDAVKRLKDKKSMRRGRG